MTLDALSSPFPSHTAFEAAYELRQYLVRRLGSLDRLRAGHWPVWRELAVLFAPQRGRFLEVGNAARGRRNDAELFDNTPLLAARTLASGMMAGISSPARPWFRLSLPDGIAHPAIAGWLELAQQRLLHVFARSNLYNCLHTLYGELGVFGTAAVWIDEDEEDIVRGYALTAGEYWLASSRRLAVDTLYRTLWWSARQIVESFGRDAVSPAIGAAWDQGRYDDEFEIVHGVEPDQTGAFPYRSVWFERAQVGTQPLLRLAGYEEFPCMAPRWDVSGTEIWGSGPGRIALGDARLLQIQQARKLEAIHLQVNPPLVAPPALHRAGGRLLPGSVTYLADPTGQGMRPAWDVRVDLTHLLADIATTQDRVRRAFYADLFLMMAESPMGQLTAREVDERHEEKMLMLGPVLERLHDELLDPLLRRVLAILLRHGLLPHPGFDPRLVQIEFISLLASAQKAAALTALERFWRFGQAVAALKPEALQRLDAAGSLDAYAELTGVPPGALAPQGMSERVSAPSAAEPLP